ncbi:MULTISPECIES: helix-turn-helix domain-containing protein [Streptomyces]|uniref:Helix-turn-helix domain-containing protein n=1 Tax=Streptomyces eurythermus TaxID=42237 RepID=A0ABW6YYB9_9ACTN|nr:MULTISPECIES: helix-turn-helix transcriptional regulator [Streptomyces]QIS69676.1 helix-turn-helix transcriptional regulator [Streptomyces sp. DSM 40868]
MTTLTPDGEHGGPRAAGKCGSKTGCSACRPISSSSSQVYRLVVERPERLSLKILMALLDILDCTMDDLIEPIAVVGAVKKPKKAAVGGTAADTEGLGGLRPKRARIKGVDRP